MDVRPSEPKPKTNPLICHVPRHDPGRRIGKPGGFEYSSTALHGHFSPRMLQDHLPNRAQGARENSRRSKAGPKFLATNLQVAPFKKARILAKTECKQR